MLKITYSSGDSLVKNNFNSWDSDSSTSSADEVEESESQELKLFLTRESPEEYVILSKEDSMKLNYQLKQSRKLKSGELHYIDHPKFGIIYRIVKTEKIEQS